MPKAPIHLLFALVFCCLTAYADTTPGQSEPAAPNTATSTVPNNTQDAASNADQDAAQSSNISLPTSLAIPENATDTDATAQNQQTQPDDTPVNQSGQTAQATPTPASLPNDLWQRIRNGYGMANLQSPFIATHEAWYAARPEYVQRMISRSQLYLYHVVEEVQKRGMPTEIALLPMVESAFNPEAYSRSKASGIWQFIPSTGRNFGLKQDWWSDNRRDVTAATDAALNYLNKLHGMFGTWELALAAYNAGEGTVQHAIDVNRRRGLPTDYQSLNLPAETREYVPKLQAVKNIISNPQEYGLKIKSIADQPYFTRVSVPKNIDVKLAAKLAGVSTQEFTQLNPAHRRPVLTSNHGSQSILLPVGAEETFETNLANYNQPLVTWQTRYAKRGERLTTIAKQYGVSVAQLQEANDISSAKKRLQSNQPILIPAPHGGQLTARTGDTPDAATPAPAATANPASARYLVKKGDSTYSIARNYGISAKQLMALNHLKSSKLHSGQLLVVRESAGNKIAAKSASVRSAPVKQASAPARQIKLAAKTEKTRYVVKRGETLASIARKFKVAASDLQRWNNLSRTRITAGRTLTIYHPDDA